MTLAKFEEFIRHPAPGFRCYDSRDPKRAPAHVVVRNERGYGFTYDFENRMTRVFSDNAPSTGQYDAGEAVHAEYVLDALGRRVQATVGGETTYRYYDRDDVLLAEFLASDTANASAVYINGTTSTDEKVLAMNDSGDEFYCLLKDLDTVAAVVDAAGAYVEAYAYGGYGLPEIMSFVPPCQRGDLNADGKVDGQDIQVFENVLLGSDTDPNHLCAADFDGDSVVDMADVPEFTVCLLYGLCPAGPGSEFANPFLFTGQRLDRLDGGDLLLYDYKARAFDPMHGRFLQRDPAEFADGYNFYEYVRSRPTVLIDPTGQFTLGDVNVTQFITRGLQAWTKFDSAQQVFEVAKALKSGVSAQGVLLTMVFELATDKLGGKLFDKFLDSVDTLRQRFPGRVFRGRKGGLDHRGTVEGLADELGDRGFQTRTDFVSGNQELPGIVDTLTWLATTRKLEQLRSSRLVTLTIVSLFQLVVSRRRFSTYWEQMLLWKTW